MGNSLKIVEKGAANGSIQESIATPKPLQAGRPTIEGLYVHIPFCFHKCHYCDFYSITAGHNDPDRLKAFTDRLIAEIRLRATQCDLRPTTVFVGGGTPSLLPADQWRRLGRVLNELGNLDQATERTIEANPETVTEDRIAAWCEAGINRVSIGAQSFDPRRLKLLERHHDPAAVDRAVDLVRAGGIDNINLDLIFAIPGQTADDVADDLDRALALNPDHLSVYGLTFEPDTALTTRRDLGRIQEVDESRQRRMYQRVISRLADAGYEHYEISNWARPGRRCAHNLLYWHNRAWLGVGPSAASHVASWRWRNRPHLGQWMISDPEPPTEDHEHLPPDQRLGEQLMLGLRVREGIDLNRLDPPLDEDNPRRQTVDQFQVQGLLTMDEGHLRLTDRGLMVADSVLSELL
ncbi:MAG: radical SAM family heme chaperone HemW [Phycisphaeraceae bacterium]|nr:radical SAM family heme chaperone HemW [Phycisphaeraceae bacterium]